MWYWSFTIIIYRNYFFIHRLSCTFYFVWFSFSPELQQCPPQLEQSQPHWRDFPAFFARIILFSTSPTASIRTASTTNVPINIPPDFCQIFPVPTPPPEISVPITIWGSPWFTIDSGIIFSLLSVPYNASLSSVLIMYSLIKVSIYKLFSSVKTSFVKIK